ncbi:hypothetical protein GCM10027284_12290 [Cyclobacterium sediminis]
MFFWYGFGFQKIKIGQLNFKIMSKSSYLISAKMFLVFVTALVLVSCEGPIGPIGPAGEDGVNIVGEVFEIEGDFNQSGNFGISGQYGFDILESDKVLIYRLAGLDQNNNDIWKLIPQVVFHSNGIFSYDYDFTFYDYAIYMNGDFDLNTLESGYTDAQIFRVLIVPADRIDVRMDYSDHKAVLEMLGVKEKEIVRRNSN